ncbi:helix-turn-helix domain-containing protein [Microbispora triticiradicis]|uniref:PucR family transcriptional regulator n=2 Tax=Microbispora TaxID=2005 RepID=A0ABY3LZE2_9ACTN|nr:MULTISPECIES: helix-turn-helix domain-containing protein [Microbispora]TLP53504.1 PucR family transcriptional regulator [Microbispora fusca]TYB61152.1 PucR family transcriptional regulator [Microbispora tritici]
MRRVSDLLRTPAGRRLTLVAGPWDAREVDSVVLVDEMRELAAAAPGALAILSRHAMRSCDVAGALRLAGGRGLAGIVLPGPSGTSPEMVEVARRERVALLAGASDHSLSDTVLGLSAAVRADPGLLLRRTREAIDGLGAMEGAGEDDILRAASASVGVAYRASGLAAPGANATVIRIGGRPDGYVCWDGEDPAAAIVAQVVATTLGRVRAAARETEAARERALLALLGARDGGAAARRARHAGVPVEGWHVAVFLRDPAAGVTDAVLREVRRTAGATLPGLLGLGEAADLAAPPLVTRWQDGVLVVLTTDERTTARAPAGGSPDLGTGVGTCQSGPDGLRRTASQARAAAARAEAGQAVAFDRLGVHALLAELGGSESALMAARDLLAPLERLGALSAHAVPTLKAYLDCWGSRTRAAELLSLHPNAVAHRIRRIAETLDADLSDPQTRFALQLACHVVLDHDCLPGTTTSITSS